MILLAELFVRRTQHASGCKDVDHNEEDISHDISHTQSQARLHSREATFQDLLDRASEHLQGMTKAGLTVIILHGQHSSPFSTGQGCSCQLPVFTSKSSLREYVGLAEQCRAFQDYGSWACRRQNCPQGLVNPTTSCKSSPIELRLIDIVINEATNFRVLGTSDVVSYLAAACLND